MGRRRFHRLASGARLDCTMNEVPSKTVAIQTHGCKLNQADSEALAQRFVKAGYLVVDSDSRGRRDSGQ